MPPPPVAGAAVTSGLADWRGVADWAAEGLPLTLGVVAPGVLAGRSAGVVETAPAGDNGVGVTEGKDPEGKDPEQAETSKDASMAKVAQPTTVSLALRFVPVMAVRIFMGLLMPPEDGGYVFPVSVPEGKSRPSQAGSGSADGHKGNARRRRRHAMACSSLEY
ncbi:MAG: hypothetical protein M3Y33_05530 [Actinomycetota bacterium]|nr:hypothetical protein [Actinomycetota bacterium]